MGTFGNAVAAKPARVRREPAYIVSVNTHPCKHRTRLIMQIERETEEICLSGNENFLKVPMGTFGVRLSRSLCASAASQHTFYLCTHIHASIERQKSCKSHKKQKRYAWGCFHELMHHMIMYRRVSHSMPKSVRREPDDMLAI